jgi:hypothetical protein
MWIDNIDLKHDRRLNNLPDEKLLFQRDAIAKRSSESDTSNALKTQSMSLLVVSDTNQGILFT